MEFVTVEKWELKVGELYRTEGIRSATNYVANTYSGISILRGHTSHITELLTKYPELERQDTGAHLKAALRAAGVKVYKFNGKSCKGSIYATSWADFVDKLKLKGVERVDQILIMKQNIK